MSRILVIPDVHLKTKIFDRADAILKYGQADKAIQMGDMVDDWGEEFNIALYSRTLERAIKFQEDHPNTIWVVGNHDFGYWHPSWGKRETGHSYYAEGDVRTLLEELERKGGKQHRMYIEGGCIFTHAGLTCTWVARRKKSLGMSAKTILDTDGMYDLVNTAALEEMWEEDSPIWARPQLNTSTPFPAKLQVTGHTPVERTDVYNEVLSTDSFSTYRNGAPYGDQKFAIVDTVTGEWSIAKEEDG